ncbi:hypothetical protein Dimus_008836 [Dionaea muscipula]
MNKTLINSSKSTFLEIIHRGKVVRDRPQLLVSEHVKVGTDECARQIIERDLRPRLSYIRKRYPLSRRRLGLLTNEISTHTQTLTRHGKSTTKVPKFTMRSATLVDPAHEIAASRRPSPRFRMSSWLPSPSNVWQRLLAAVTSPIVAVKTRATLILDLDVSLITERALDSLDDVGGGRPTAVAAFARASSPLAKSLVAAVAVECPERHAAPVLPPPHSSEAKDEKEGVENLRGSYVVQFK